MIDAAHPLHVFVTRRVSRVRGSNPTWPMSKGVRKAHE